MTADLPVPAESIAAVVDTAALDVDDLDEALMGACVRAIAIPVVAAELEAQADHFDWVARGASGRYAVAAADIAHRLRARAVELGGGNDTTEGET